MSRSLLGKVLTGLHYRIDPDAQRRNIGYLLQDIMNLYRNNNDVPDPNYIKMSPKWLMGMVDITIEYIASRKAPTGVFTADVVDYNMVFPVYRITFDTERHHWNQTSFGRVPCYLVDSEQYVGYAHTVYYIDSRGLVYCHLKVTRSTPYDQSDDGDKFYYVSQPLRVQDSVCPADSFDMGNIETILNLALDDGVVPQPS